MGSLDSIVLGKRPELIAQPPENRVHATDSDYKDNIILQNNV